MRCTFELAKVVASTAQRKPSLTMLQIRFAYCVVKTH